MKWRGVFVRKKIAFIKCDMVLFKDKRRELRVIIKKSKQEYKTKPERHFSAGDEKKEWSSLNIMMGRDVNKQQFNRILSATELNQFYRRFHTNDHNVSMNNVYISIGTL